MINDNKECLPVASPYNATEDPALLIARRQRHFRQFTEVGRRKHGSGIHQFICRDVSQLLHQALQRAQVRAAESVRVDCLQPLQ